MHGTYGTTSADLSLQTYGWLQGLWPALLPQETEAWESLLQRSCSQWALVQTEFVIKKHVNKTYFLQLLQLYQISTRIDWNDRSLTACLGWGSASFLIFFPILSKITWVLMHLSPRSRSYTVSHSVLTSCNELNWITISNSVTVINKYSLKVLNSV